MIDEKVLIERLENRIEYNKACHEEFPNAKMSLVYEVQINAYKNAIEIVKDLASEHNNGWIPCEVRLPEKKKEVLIFADDNAIFVGHLMNGGFIVHDGDGWIDLKFILAWQPLPPAPKKGE